MGIFSGNSEWSFGKAVPLIAEEDTAVDTRPVRICHPDASVRRLSGCYMVSAQVIADDYATLLDLEHICKQCPIPKAVCRLLHR